MQLDDLEKMAYEGLIAREQNISREQERLQADYANLVAALEQRLKLKKGAIGTTHTLDLAGVKESSG